MNWSGYVEQLRRDHAQALSTAPGPGRGDLRLNAALAAVFAALAGLLFAIGGYQSAFETLHGISDDFPAALLESLTYLGDTLLSICLMAFFARRQPRVVWMAVIASLYATVLSRGLKSLFNAARPPAVLGDWLHVVGPVLKTHSFPSGHTVTAFVVAACFSVGAPRSAKASFYLLAAAVGLSRVWVGVHWPVDVLAGAMVGCVAVALAVYTTRFWNWGLGFAPQMSFVALVAACCLAELIRVPDYPLARPMAQVVAVLSLGILARDFVPRMRRKSVGPGA